MHTLRMLALIAALLSSAQLSADEPEKSDRSGSKSSVKEKEKKPDYAKLLLGKWTRTDGQYAGTTMVFDKNGSFTTARVAKPGENWGSMSGTWKIDGEFIAQTIRDNGYVTETKVTIVSLTETELRFKNKGGQEATYERVADVSKESEQSGSRSAGKDKTTKPDAKLLIGKWVRVDKIQGTGTTMDYFKDGTHVTHRPVRPGDLPTGMKGTWKLDGDKLIQTLGPMKFDTSVTITKLTETEFHFRNRSGQDVHYERVVDKAERSKGEKSKNKNKK
jgi:uncharacterized protein (TIGR03066 family)